MSSAIVSRGGRSDGMTWVAHESRRRPTGGSTAAALGVAVAGLAVFVAWATLRELRADSYLLLFSGRDIARHGIAYQDPFAIAAGAHHYANQQWLAGLITYGAFLLGGYHAVLLLAAALIGSGYGLLAALVYRRSDSSAAVLGCGVIALLGLIGFAFVRAELFAIPLFVATLWLCDRDREHDHRPGRAAIGLIALLILWANLHGSVLLGVAVAALSMTIRGVAHWRAGRPRAALGYAATALAAALAPLATPYGTGILSYYTGLIGNHAIVVADVEWGPPTQGGLPLLQFVLPLGLAILAVVAILRAGRRPSWPAVIAVAVAAVSAGTAFRNNTWLAIAAAWLLAEAVAPVVQRHRLPARGLAVLAIAAAALVVVDGARMVTQATDTQALSPVSSVAPVADYVATHPCARVIADNQSASVLLWLAPQLARHIAYDAELEMYTPRALIAWVQFQAAAGPDWLTAAHGYDVLVASPHTAPTLAQQLTHLPGSHVLRHDATGIAVTRAQVPAVCPQAG